MELNNSASGETSLVFRLKNQDAEAWEQLVHLYGPLIFHWCRTCKLKEADCADVMQDVFKVVAGKMATFQNKKNGSMRGWLWTITQNKIRDFIRVRSGKEVAAGGTVAQIRLSEIPSDWDEHGSAILDSQEDPTDQIESHRLLHRALEQIRPEFSSNSWTAFWGTVVKGRPTRDIAEELQISMAGVRQAKRRILRRVKMQLGEIE